MANLMFAVIGVAVLALLFALITAKKVIKSDPGEEAITSISAIIKKSANAFLKKQYTVVAIFFAAVFAVLMAMNIPDFIKGDISGIYTPFAFLTGGIYSGLAGYIGMRIATTSNCRTVVAARTSLNKGLRTAFSSGMVMGMTVVGLGLFDISVWFVLLKFVFKVEMDAIANSMVSFGIGASSMALFARVGGGIFTKAADVGADLCGKVEAGIPEDDIRNPAVIADNVGDNVGDVAGMGADLYESYVGSILSCAALAWFAFGKIGGFILPFMLAAAGIIASIIGSIFVRTKENASQKELLGALRKGLYITSGIIVVASFLIIKFVAKLKNAWFIWGAVMCGVLAGVIIGSLTEHYTSDTYKPTKKLSKSSETGSATVIIEGLSLGMRSTFGSVIIVAIAIIGSFVLASHGAANTVEAGLFGVGAAAVGMLSTLGLTLATDAYGPVADNAGGIAEMSGQEEYVRERTDALDSLGNTTAATGKGFAIGSAALTAITLIAAFKSTIENSFTDFKFNLDILNVQVLVGLFIGVMLPFLFSSVTMSAVGRAASKVVMEVRRQFKEIPGIMEGKNKPEYEKCIEICTSSSQHEMVVPAIIAVVAPIVTGALLGFNGIAGMLAGTATSGFLLAVMMSNSGGAWDNAKKYIEGGNFGGKGSDSHKAAVVGDTVGDPFKDTSGPSINILIKLISTVSIVFAPIIYWLFNLIGSNFNL